MPLIGPVGNLPIRTRLNMLIGTLLVLALAANIVAIVLNAGARIRAEDDSILRLTRQTIDRGLGELRTSRDPARELARLVDGFAGLRHVSVLLQPAGAPAIVPRLRQTTGEAAQVPDWFARAIITERSNVPVPVVVEGQRLGDIVIAANPWDEISEIWGAVTDTLLGGLVLIAAVFALTSLAVRQALGPVQRLGAALNLMESGDYEVRVATTGPPELADISAKLNALAAALKRTRSDNGRLAEQLISVGDQERRELARELHDEIGPYLFSIRAMTTAVMGEAGGLSSSAGQAIRRKGAVLLEQIDAVQQLNRRVLQRLRPPALAEIGLAGALDGLVGIWRENHPEVRIDLAVDLGALDLDQTAQLTVYRVVQEGVTNAFRHAGARQITIGVGAEVPARLTITVSDDGMGLDGEAKPGFGLSGMGERVWALGGTMEITNTPVGGARLVVTLPLGGARAAVGGD
jgi:two-component system, NarL family, sensor histidine kinase UhpB